MDSILVAIGITLSSMMKLGLPPDQPVIESRSIERLQTDACGSPVRCPDLYVFTEPTTGKIVVADGIDWSMTVAQAELAREYGRWLLTKHKIYSPSNTCTRNVKLERRLLEIEWDFMQIRKNEGKFKGYNMPPTKDVLPEHLFFCVPDDKTVPRVKDRSVTKGEF